jgi:hypothetical protein
MASIISGSRLVELVKSVPDFGSLFAWVQNPNQLAFGATWGMPLSILDLTAEKIITPTAGDISHSTAAGKTSRRMGLFWFEFLGQRVECRSKKHVLVEALRSIEEKYPGTMEELSHLKPRSRRVVARDRTQLYENENLRNNIGSFSVRLNNDWWVGTNTSGREANVWLQRACKCAGLSWGRDLNTNLDPSARS